MINKMKIPKKLLELGITEKDIIKQEGLLPSGFLYMIHLDDSIIVTDNLESDDVYNKINEIIETKEKEYDECEEKVSYGFEGLCKKRENEEKLNRIVKSAMEGDIESIEFLILFFEKQKVLFNELEEINAKKESQKKSS